MLIVDLGLKGPSGIELTKSLRVEFPKMPVLIVSMHDEPTYAVRSLRAGANGYVTKEEALGSVLVAVREGIGGGDQFFSGGGGGKNFKFGVGEGGPRAPPPHPLKERGGGGRAKKGHGGGRKNKC